MDEKAIELVLNKLEELGRNYGPAFSEQAIKYAHIKAFENTFIPLFMFCLSTYAVRKAYDVLIKESAKNYRDQREAVQFPCILIVGIGGLLGLAMLCMSLNPAAWYGLFDPAAYLSYRLFEKVL